MRPLTLTKRLPIVGVFGANEDTLKKMEDFLIVKSFAYDLGFWLATLDVHLLTGGGGGIMEAACKGFCSFQGRKGISLGIIPGNPRSGYPNPWVEIPILTHLTGASGSSRNPINAGTIDLAIVLPGGKGTNDEVALILEKKKPMLVWYPFVGRKSKAKTRSTSVKTFVGLKHALTRELNKLVGTPHLLTTKRMQITFPRDPAAAGLSLAEGQLTAGSNTYNCLGRRSCSYPRDLTVQTSDKEPDHYSQEYQVDMYWAIRIWPQRGIYIHQDADSVAGNGGDESAGCIHLADPNAKTVYDWVDGPTRITIDYPW